MRPRRPRKTPTYQKKSAATKPLEPHGKERPVEPEVHLLGKGIRCDTDTRGHASPGGRSPLELVLEASEGFIPLWAADTTLRWRFRESSLGFFQSPSAAKAEIRRLIGEAMLAWGEAAPIKLAEREDAWDFEVVMRSNDDCDSSGCVLASAFFPDAGRHQMHLYPKLFTQDEHELIETLVHEIGHIFGLRHFFANLKETRWPSQVFGTQNPFTIMNYGELSMLTPEDLADLKRLYRLVWRGELTEINGTPIKIVKPYHTTIAHREGVIAVAMENSAFQPLPRAAYVGRF